MQKRDDQLIIRIDTATKKAFITACHGQDRNASQVLRDYMRAYIAQHGQAQLKLPH
jgi:uncharacterized protein GlcG (DUF336 family)